MLRWTSCHSVPVRVNVDDDGQFDYAFTNEPNNILLYDRGDGLAQQDALRMAFPGWYSSFSLERENILVPATP